MPFATEFWVATAIAVIALVLGLGATIAMDAKTKGEFRFAITCFLVSAAAIVYGIGTWEVNTALPNKYRIPIALILFAGTALGTVETIRWAHARHLRVAEAGKPPNGGHKQASSEVQHHTVLGDGKKHDPKTPAKVDDSKENTSALNRPYLSSTGTGGFSHEESTDSVYLTFPFMNNSLHSAFDLRTRIVLVQQSDFKIVATDDTSLAGEISPMQQTDLFWHTPPAPKDNYDMPPLYVILAFQYSGRPDVSHPQYYQLFYMKWAGIQNGVIEPRMTYLQIEERNRLVEQIEEHNIRVMVENNQPR